MEKKNYRQVYLEERKYRMKKTKMTNFIQAELESESELELESDIKLEPKSELESDTEQLSKQAFWGSSWKSHILKYIF